MDTSAVRPRAPRKLRISVLTLMALVACCASLLWAWRAIRDLDPTVQMERALTRGTAEERREALQSLAVDDLGMAVRVLPGLIRNAPAEDRLTAVLALNRLVRLAATIRPNQIAPEVRAASATLLDVTRDPVPDVRRGAVMALAGIGLLRPHLARDSTPEPDRVIAALIPLLGDDDEQVAGAAAVALGSGDWRAPAACAAMLRAERSGRPAIRKASLQGLAEYGSTSDPALMALLQALVDPDAEVRSLADSLLYTAIKTRRTMPAAARPIVEPLIAAEHPSENAYILIHALRLAAPDARPYLPLLLKIARDPSHPHRFSARKALGAILPKTPEARAFAADFVAMYRAGGLDARREAIQGLAAYTWETETVLPLLRSARSDPDPAIRAMADQSLKSDVVPMPAVTSKRSRNGGARPVAAD